MTDNSSVSLYGCHSNNKGLMLLNNHQTRMNKNSQFYNYKKQLTKASAAALNNDNNHSYSSELIRISSADLIRRSQGNRDSYQ